ncbi:SCO family protein [Chondromyces apiculatus]|uniref:SCO1/SenC family protein n=1 Tax=Chondromyces apiculatus DSM 436 TaxID=1192034 RepID=A0A017TCD6_9BACT|nr:SCO family protein [Chondromyces apiculatus]EYF06919.1 SCO1/SenC family protein [Chondromyces apiculatus DSM 436]
MRRGTVVRLAVVRLAVALALTGVGLGAGAAFAGQGGPAAAPPPGGAVALPPVARGADIEERLGQAVRKDLAFTDAAGREVRLGDYLGGDRPLVLVLAYYRCPALCSMVLRGLVEGLGRLSFTPGDEYQVLTVSFDPRDTAAAAAKKQAGVLAELSRGREGAAVSPKAWPFVVGKEAEIGALAADLGFQFAFDPATEQYAHPAAVFVLTPDGRISRYLYGADYPARDLRLALLEASEGKVGGIVDRVIMTCYRYDPATRRYGPAISGFFRLGSVGILATVGTLLATLWHRDRKQRRQEREEAGHE